MKSTDLEYGTMVTTIKPYTDKGRPISIAFLNWFLEHIYRLDQVAAEDAICDKSNDRGIDGIYVDENQLEIHVLQSKTKQNGTIGDKDIREFSGTLTIANGGRVRCVYGRQSRSRSQRQDTEAWVTWPAREGLHRSRNFYNERSGRR